jgi:hypothetical protein
MTVNLREWRKLSEAQEGFTRARASLQVLRTIIRVSIRSGALLAIALPENRSGSLKITRQPLTFRREVKIFSCRVTNGKYAKKKFPNGWRKSLTPTAISI